MNAYLTVITTILVLTQIIRITQNHFSLRRERKLFEKQLKGLADVEPTKEDFATQKKAYKLIVEYLESKT